MDNVSQFKLEATKLHASLSEGGDGDPLVLRVSTSGVSPKREEVFLTTDGVLPSGYGAYLVPKGLQSFSDSSDTGPVYTLPSDLAYLEDGDIVRINPRGREIWVMYRRASRTNSLLLTERCNSWCIMCSQPPRAIDDRYLVDAWLQAIPLMDKDTGCLGFTGGEPTLLKDDFLRLVECCKAHLPTTGIHVLSNGRMFNYLSFAQALGSIGHPDLVVGIPLYSDLAWQHEFIVQAPGSFDQTIRGLLNLARCRVASEIRIVIHSESVDRLSSLAEFITRNLPFVHHVALMGLEPIGFAKSNIRALWADPVDYQHQLARSVHILSAHGLNVSIYNHQLCVLPEDLWPFARQSISDWKNIYLPECDHCALQGDCGGFFHSATHIHSRAIRPFSNALLPIASV